MLKISRGDERLCARVANVLWCAFPLGTERVGHLDEAVGRLHAIFVGYFVYSGVARRRCEHSSASVGQAAKYHTGNSELLWIVQHVESASFRPH